jgi:hypothetical protein
MIRRTGRLPDAVHLRAGLRSASPYRARGDFELRTVIQPWLGSTDQQSKPSCVGHAIRGRLRSLTAYDPSAVDLWTDSRRLDGSLADPLSGTMATSAISSLTRRGASPYRDGEDSRSTDLDVAQCDIRSDLSADAHRLPMGFRHSTVWGPISQMLVEIVDALAAGLVVVVGAGRKEPYFAVAPNVILDGAYWGGARNGHEEGIFGYVHEISAFLVAGSWGPSHGGVVVEGREYPGCVLVEAATVLTDSWDIDVFEVTQ